MAERGIVITERRDGIRISFAWGYVTILPDGTCECAGPGADRWFDADDAVETSRLFMPGASALMAFALAVQLQYSAWKGAQTLAR